MNVTIEMKTELANMIAAEIRENFRTKYLSGNLSNTIKVDIDPSSGKVSVDIIAHNYDIKRFKRYGDIVYEGNGSYAEQVNQTGGFSGYHKDYVDIAISKAISKWMKKYKMEGKIR